MKNKLEKLLYRKKVLEFTLKKYQKGGFFYSELCEILKTKIKSEKDKYLKVKFETELIKNEIEAANYITSYKNSLSEYKDYLIPEIDSLKKEYPDKNGEPNIEFINFDEEAKDLAEYELFGKTTPTPANVELPKIIKDIENHIIILEKFSKAIDKKLKDKTDKDVDYDKIKLLIEKYNTENHIQTLRKRYNERKEYYIDIFLPQYEKDMKEAKVYLHKYLDIAKKVSDYNIDPRMRLLLQEYEKHKTDKEKLWLFFTALKTRLTSIKEELSTNKKAVFPQDLKKEMIIL